MKLHLTQAFEAVCAGIRGRGMRAAAIAALLSATAIIHAQGYGSISGAVTDPSGAIIPGATVTATQTDTGRVSTVTSGADGRFVFTALPPAPYSITVAAAGFQNYDQKGIVLQANQAMTVNAKLAIGSNTQTVNVSGEAPQVNTTNGTLAQVVDRDRVVELPLNGRNAATLITLVAGVSPAPSNGLDQGTTKTFPVAVDVTANGTQVNQSNYLFDGGNNVDEMTNVNAPFPFPDALQEFSVQTSNYDASFGQSAGAVVNIVSRSGSNKFHGDLFEFVRNGYFDAKPFFGTTADHLHRHQFGGTIGGPLKLPRLSSGATTQFFLGYQHTLVHNNSNANQAVVPTAGEKGLTPTGAQLGYADFSNLCSTGFNASGFCTTATQQIYNPFTGTEYALNHIPSSAFDPAAVAFEKALPTATTTPALGKVGGTVNYFSPTTQDYNEYLGRVDHNFGSSDHIFGHYYYNDFNQAGVYNPTNLLNYSSFSNIRYQSALIAETHTFSPNLLNSLVVNYQREVSLRGGPPGSPDITGFGVQNIWQPPQNNVIEGVSVTGFFRVSGSAFASFYRNNYTFNDDLHWVKGKHNFAFGGHFELSKYDVTNVFNSNGSFSFNTVGANSENALANFQMGYMSGFGQGNYELVNDRAHFPGIYAQDSWKLTPRFTLNYGVRWESFQPWANRLGEQTVFSPAAYTANRGTSQYNTLPAGLLITGDPIPQNGVYNQYKQFMPRVGFALDLFGDGKTAIRGGFGIFYQDRMPGFFNLSQTSNVPFTTSVSTIDPAGTEASPGGPFSNPYCSPVNGAYRAPCTPAGQVANPFPFTLPFPKNYVFPKPITVDEYEPSGNFKVPVTDDFNLAFERQLFPNWSLRVAYVGSVSRHQFVSLELNPAVNNGTKLGTNLRRVYNTPPIVGPCTSSTGCGANYSNIIKADMSASASYNSLQVTLEKRMSRGLSVLANYTWSKSLDNLPYSLSVSNTEDLNNGESYVYPVYPPGVSTWYPVDYKALDYGPSDFDHPQTVSISYVYNLPKVKIGNRLLSAVTNGWQTSGLIQHNSGDALTATAGADISLTGLGQDRAQRNLGVSAYSSTGNCQPTHSCVNWLNPRAFALPVNTGPGTGYGNVVKGSLRGPGYTNWDGAAIRVFPMFRETTLQFRAEYFDLLNHTILKDPSTSSPTSTTFGTITGENAAGPRIAQFSLKYVF